MYVCICLCDRPKNMRDIPKNEHGSYFRQGLLRASAGLIWLEKYFSPENETQNKKIETKKENNKTKTNKTNTQKRESFQIYMLFQIL